METFKSPRGRVLRAYGDLSLLTMDRMTVFGDHIDSDPRIVSLSLAPSPTTAGSWLRSTMPAGSVIGTRSQLTTQSRPLPRAAASSTIVRYDSRLPISVRIWAREKCEVCASSSAPITNQPLRMNS